MKNLISDKLVRIAVITLSALILTVAADFVVHLFSGTSDSSLYAYAVSGGSSSKGNTDPIQKKKYASRLWTVERPVAHACGGINGVNYTNSKEALKNALKSNVRSVEIDFVFTTDNRLVCSHYWSFNYDQPMSLSEFRKLKINGSLTTMTAKRAILMLAKKKAYLIVDAKYGQETEVYRELIRLCKEADLKWYRKYIIPQLYTYEDYRRFRKIFKFRYGIFTTYKLGNTYLKTYRKVAGFCRKHKLTACVNESHYTKKTARIFKKKKVAVAVYTVNKKKKARRLIRKGAAFIYTDQLYDL